MKNGYPNGIEIAAIVYSQILLVAIAAALAVAILAVTAAVVATTSLTDQEHGAEVAPEILTLKLIYKLR